MVLSGSWQRYPIHTAFATLGMVLSAVYILRMHQRTMNGPVTAQVEEHLEKTDLTTVEKLVIAPVLAVLLFFGFMPQPAIGLLEPTAKAVLQQVGVQDPEPVVKGVK